VNVSRTGFNQWNEEWEKGAIAGSSGMPVNFSNRIRSKNFSPCLGGVKYYVCNEFDEVHRIFWYDSDHNYISYTGGKKFVSTSPNNARYFKVTVEGSTYGETYRHDICVNIFDPEKNGTYEPYKGSTYSVNWESEAGTVYGGTLDVVSGKLTVDRVIIAVKDMAWARTTSYAHPVFYVNQGGKAASYGKSACSFLRNIGRASIISANAFASLADNGDFALGASNTQIYVRYDDITDVNTFKTQFADETFVYPLVTPQTYQLTPQEVRTLLGVNNIWSDGGDMEVEYPADTKLYIQRLTGSDEDDMVANSNIPDATYFLISNTLYKSTAAIASGDPIVPGTNCTVTNLAEALNALNTTT
jgi:hypothetical protein